MISLPFKKLRLYFAWIFAIFLAAALPTVKMGFAIGIPVIAAGEVLRIWSQGSIQKRIRLATGGPYAYVRNPLYVSNFLIGFGFVLFFYNGWLTFVYCAGFFVLYRGTVIEEEQFLMKQYGEIYQQYLEQVPRFFPRWKPFLRDSDQTFNWKLVLQHGENVTFLSIILLVFMLLMKHERFLRGGNVWGSASWLLIGGLITVLLLAFSMIQRKFKSKLK